MSLLFGTQIQSTYMMNGFSNDITGFKTPLGKGVYNQNHYQYNVIPLVQNGDYIAGDSSGGTGHQTVYRTTITDTNLADYWFSVVLRSNSWVASKGNTKLVVMDCPRCISVDFDGPTTAVTTVTITGADNNLKSMIEKKQILLATDGTVTFDKSFYLVESIYFSSDPGVQVAVGSSNIFGIPHLVPNVNYIHKVIWDGTDLGTSVFTPGYNWRNTSNTNTDANYNQPTGYSIDAKGVVDLTAQTDPDSSRMLSVFYYVYGSDSELYAQSENSVDNSAGKIDYKTPRFQLPIRQNTSANMYIYPYLLEQDLTGAQFPEDQVFMTKYRALLAT